MGGRVRISAGDNVTELEAGDFISYHCDVDHSIENLSKEPAVVHMVVRFHKPRWA